jgi:phage tail-like protein
MLPLLSKDFASQPINVHYALDVDNTRLAIFTKMSGGEIEVNVIKHNVVYPSGEYRTLLIPGPTQYSPITLESGFGNSKALYNWFIQANRGRTAAARKNITITLHVREEGRYKPVVSWNLIGAWPTKISGIDSSQDGSPGVARFSLTINMESIERVDAS